MCVVIRAFERESVSVCVSVCVKERERESFIDQQMKAVCVMRTRQPDGLMGNKKPFIYLYNLIKWHVFLSPGVYVCPCVLMCVRVCVCVCVCVCLVFNDK